ncbi:glycoside hydrolase family 2 TIM barrel-domain containing protein [Haloterrigena gelatinilytica]|uniref:glycoside hydrolase family 2 TIM barrel-domain containing protein n=1 Tax=Haloterrigena gelatinilytica TaxID=2741724 RepID=UPI001C2E329A|nr:glycoside hydrolase family 2 TIM barrel-domain containing protein [Haloterrigena gelatinilytica]
MPRPVGPWRDIAIISDTCLAIRSSISKRHRYAPAYHNINFGDEDVQELYRQQLRELIQRDWNRASVALWSIVNETDHNGDTRNELLPPDGGLRLRT